MTAPAPHEVASDVELAARARVGRTLRDKWHLDRLLGVGGMASVYAATHRNGARAAVKMLHPELVTHGPLRERFLREGYAANKVDHEGAVRVLDDDQAEDGAVYLVMELLEGVSLQTLASHRPGGRLAPAEAAAVGDQLLDVLVAAHAKGILHRDIKPDNLFVTRSGRVKVLDFGIARIRDSQSSSRATATGTVMGTPAFMPPEQAKGLAAQIGPQTDLWAVGATLFYLLTGELVHTAETASLELLAAMTLPARPVRSVEPQVHEALGAVIDKALQFEVAARWSDARSMQAALRKAAPARADLARAVAELERAQGALAEPSAPVATFGSEPWPDLSTVQNTGLVAGVPSEHLLAEPSGPATPAAAAPPSVPTSSDAAAPAEPPRLAHAKTEAQVQAASSATAMAPSVMQAALTSSVLQMPSDGISRRSRLMRLGLIGTGVLGAIFAVSWYALSHGSAPASAGGAPSPALTTGEAQGARGGDAATAERPGPSAEASAHAGVSETHDAPGATPPTVASGPASSGAARSPGAGKLAPGRTPDAGAPAATKAPVGTVFHNW